VQQRHRHERHSQLLERTVDAVQLDARNRAQRGPAVKNIRKRPPNDLERFFRAVHRQRRSLPNIKWTNIVEAQDVIRVAVGQQNGVETIEAHAQSLLAKIWRGVDHHVLPARR